MRLWNKFGTPCPFEGKIGKQAKLAWKKYNKLRPDHTQYIKNLKIKEQADEEAMILPKPKPKEIKSPK